MGLRQALVNLAISHFSGRIIILCAGGGRCVARGSW